MNCLVKYSFDFVGLLCMKELLGKGRQKCVLNMGKNRRLFRVNYNVFARFHCQPKMHEMSLKKCLFTII